MVIIDGLLLRQPQMRSTLAAIDTSDWLRKHASASRRPERRRDGYAAAHRRGDRRRLGIGKATAFLIARAGGRVLVGDVDEARGLAAAAEGTAQDLAIQYFPLDLTDQTSIDDFVATVHRQVEPVDGLVNGAGWDQIQPFLENPPEMWDRVIAVNLMGAVRLTRGVLPPMVAAGRGKIVNISSDAGRVGSMGETVYAAAKGGLIAFTKSLARELAQRQLRGRYSRRNPRMGRRNTRPRSRIIDKEISTKVIDFLDRENPKKTGKRSSSGTTRLPRRSRLCYRRNIRQYRASRATKIGDQRSRHEAARRQCRPCPEKS